MRPRLEVEPPQAWYYCISPNSYTLVILLQVDPTFGDEPQKFCESFYKVEDTSTLHGLQFSLLDIIVGCVVQFVNCFLLAGQIT